TSPCTASPHFRDGESPFPGRRVGGCGTSRGRGSSCCSPRAPTRSRPTRPPGPSPRRCGWRRSTPPSPPRSAPAPARRGDSSLLYHQGLPSAVVDATPWELPDQVTTENRPLLPRHLKLHELFPGEDWKALDAVTGRRLVLGNGDLRISYVVAGEASPLYRN